MREDLEYESFTVQPNAEELEQVELVRSYDLAVPEGTRLDFQPIALQYEAWVGGKLEDTFRSSALRCVLEREVDGEVHGVWLETTYDIAPWQEAVESLVYAALRNLDARIARSTL